MQQRINSRPRRRHAKTEELQEAVLPRVPAPGGQYRCNGTRDTMISTSTEERFFCVRSALRLYHSTDRIELVSGIEPSRVE
jgi:hypothetical protein